MYSASLYYYQYLSESEPRSWRGVLDKTLCDQICQWFSRGTPVFSANKTEIVLKMAINTINQP